MRRKIEFGKGWGLGLSLRSSEEGAFLSFQPIYGRIHFPLWFKLKTLPDMYCILPSWGFNWEWTRFRGDLFVHWGKRTWVFRAPWAWEHVRHDILLADSTWHRMGRRQWERPKNAMQDKYTYRYNLKSGKVQETTATVGIEEREWRWRWLTWCPWPRLIRRSIEVNFADEIGERAGSWKGGCLGCGYDMREGESAEQTLRRMERERVFS